MRCSEPNERVDRRVNAELCKRHELSCFSAYTLEDLGSLNKFSKNGPASHCQKNETAPVNAHPKPSARSNRLMSLLILIPWLKPVTKGTSAFAFQNPVRCMYAAAAVATLTSAIMDVISDLKNATTELIRERDIYTNQNSPCPAITWIRKSMWLL